MTWDLIWVLVLALMLGAMAGCGVPGPGVHEPVSFGKTSRGYLHRGAALPNRGPGYVRARSGESTRYGLPRLISALEEASASVAQVFPDGPTVRIGDLSGPHGGRHPRHGSHRTGRDADVIFYATDATGHAVQGRGWYAYDRFGVARDSNSASGDLFFFDTARNWQFVRTLLLNNEARVQWLFCSSGVKARLLRYAAVHETDPKAIFRAAWVLHQPSRGNPHADHFHVRLACSARDQALGCRDRGPIWPWLRPDEKMVNAQTSLTDDALVDFLSAEDMPDTDTDTDTQSTDNK